MPSDDRQRKGCWLPPCILTDPRLNSVNVPIYFISITSSRVICHSFLTGLPNMCMCAKLLQSCPTLCNPMDCSLPGSCVHGILQARIQEWVPCSPPGDLFPTQGSNPSLFRLLHWQVDSLPGNLGNYPLPSILMPISKSYRSARCKSDHVTTPCLPVLKFLKFLYLLG